MGPGQFQEKGKNADCWIEYFFFEKKLSTENKNSKTDSENIPITRLSIIIQIGLAVLKTQEYKRVAKYSIERKAYDEKPGVGKISRLINLMGML